MNDILKFDVNNIEFMDNIEKSLFRKVKISAFATGENAHTLPIEEDVLRRGAKTIYNKPILWKYNKYFDDAEGHEKDEVPCGFVPESDDNPVRFESKNDKTYIVINALLWTKYCGRLVEIFERDGMKKDVSVEIAVIEDENVVSDKPKIQDFVIAGITLLGEMINPACKGCEAELLEFSESKERYLNEMNFENNSIEIDNSKESAVDGEWSNPRRKLFVPIIKASNYKSLLKEAYLIGDFENAEPEITKFKYPHHVIRDGKLVIHKRGLEAAFQRASQQGIVRGDIKSHLLKHYKELGLSLENFSEFSISKEDFELYFYNELNKEVGDSNMTEKDNEKEMSECQTEEIKEVDTEMACESSEEMCDAVAVEEGCVPEEGHDHEDEHEDDHEDNHEEEHENEHAHEMSLEDAKCKIAEMEDKIKELEDSNNAYMAKIDEMADYEELKKFKADTEERLAREKEMADMQKVMSEIEGRGISMSEDDKKEFMDKIKEFSSIDAWSNYVKAQAFDRAENIDGIVKIGLSYNTTAKTGSIWDEL